MTTYGKIVGPLTKDQWDSVIKKASLSLVSSDWDSYKEDSCLSIDKDQYCSMRWYKSHGVEEFISYEHYIKGEINNSYSIF